MRSGHGCFFIAKHEQGLPVFNAQEKVVFGAIKMTSAMTLVTYFLVATYVTKLAWTDKTYENAPRPAGGSDL